MQLAATIILFLQSISDLLPPQLIALVVLTALIETPLINFVVLKDRLNCQLLLFKFLLFEFFKDVIILLQLVFISAQPAPLVCIRKLKLLHQFLEDFHFY
jgi:hypothetical protein